MNRIPRRQRAPPVALVPRYNDSLNRFKQGVRTKVSTGVEVLHAPPGKASLGKASFGKASIGNATFGKASIGKASIGKASIGKASIGKASIGKASIGKASLFKSRSKEKNVANRCCYVTPDRKNFSQYFAGYGSSVFNDTATGPERPIDRDQFPGLSGNTHRPQFGQLKKLSRHSRSKVKTGSKCAKSGSCNTPVFTDVLNESHWQKMDNPEDLDKIIMIHEVAGLDLPSQPKQIYISDVPQVKVIAEKYSKYKRGNLELRRLDEKVVCVEYDIFNQPYNHEVLKPVQRMRAFFSIKPSLDNNGSRKQELPRLPPEIKSKFDVVEEDLEKLTEKEIEFIDNEIEENQSYLQDLRRILKRKEVTNAQKNETSIDLQFLYEMARRDGRPWNSDLSESNLLSKAKLQEVKQLILQRCTSSVHGLRRRTIKKSEAKHDSGTNSGGIMSEMLKCKT